MKRSVALSLLVAATALWQAGLPAFTTNNVTWPVDPVPYYVNPANADVSSEQAVAAIRSGAAAWSMQSSAAVSLYYVGTTSGSSLQNNGRNEVFFRNESAGSMVAQTYWWADGAGRLIDADILFYDGAFRFFTGTTGCTGGVYIEDFAVHEFGHALGLSHSADPNATMYPSTTNCLQNWRTLESDDRLAIEFLYPPGTAVGPPLAPANLSAQLVAIGTAALTWVDMASNEDGFSVKRSVNGGSWQEIARLASNAALYSDLYAVDPDSV